MNIKIMRKRSMKTDVDDEGDELEGEESRLSPEEVVDALDQNPILSSRHMARVAYYSAAISILCVVFTVWLAGTYVTRLETKLYESTAGTLEQMNHRIANLEASAKPQAPRPTFVEFTPPADAPRIGSADAKVMIVEFSDFQCPFCGKFQKEIYPQLKRDYIDTGKASFVYQDFAFLGEESNITAQAARCAGEQNKYWEFHDYLFSHQDGENQGAFKLQNMKTFARTLKLNTALFNTCIDTNKYRAAVEAETASGRSVGITGTPTVLINGKVLVGALPYATFKQAIDEALAK